MTIEDKLKKYYGDNVLSESVVALQEIQQNSDVELTLNMFFAALGFICLNNEALEREDKSIPELKWALNRAIGEVCVAKFNGGFDFESQ